MRVRIAYHFDADPDPANHFNADPDPDPTFKFDADLDPLHWLFACQRTANLLYRKLIPGASQSLVNMSCDLCK
jgi:hypothetical protein